MNCDPKRFCRSKRNRDPQRGVDGQN